MPVVRRRLPRRGPTLLAAHARRGRAGRRRRPGHADDADLHVGHVRRPQGGQRHPGEGGPPGRVPVRAVRPRSRRRGLPVDADVPLQRDHGRLGPGARLRRHDRAGPAVLSASGFLTDVRRYGATYANYVGKPLAYVLATPERPDDADNPLRIVFGNEANERDIAEFGRRFGCVVVDSYSSTENAVIVQRVPDMPPGSLGRPLDGVKVLDPETMAETPDAVFGPDGRLAQCRRAHRRAGQHPGRGGVRRLLQRPRRGGRADARRHVLVRRPRLPRRRRLRLLRRAHRRLAPGRRREPRRRARRADPAAAPERLRGGGVRRPRRVGSATR